jgi:DNA-binding SARP family transcriptional activator/tetratricopeptide (TPR) repeat protein
LVEFRILGPVEVLRDGQTVVPGSPKLRALLVDLIVHHGQVVSRDRLIEDLWAASPPSTGLGVLQNYVSQLRKALGMNVVVTRGPGYLLDADPDSVDSVRFERLVEQGRAALQAGDPAHANQVVGEALGLWRGPALADVAYEPFAQAEISRLDELRAVGVELRLEAEITRGRHREAVGAGEAAVAEHPLRERLWWLLMLALYRSGRQADALRAYQRARTGLADEIGLEPGAELRDLEAAILDQRRDLDHLLVARMPRRQVARRAWPATSLLGRAEEWSTVEAVLDGTADTATGMLLLVGEPGIGKTRLLEEAQRHLEGRGGIVIAGRGYEAERGRPYGVWVDALRSAQLPAFDTSLRSALAPLLPELSDSPVQLEESNRLYDAVARLLGMLAGKVPVAVLVDDVQWLDEPSFTLLHYAVRHLASTVAFVGAARPAELDDNRASAPVMQALRRDELLSELFIGPLAPAAIAEITEPIAPGADTQEIARATHGNPLFALEMARALARGNEPLTGRVDALIGDRLARLDDSASALVPWVAAFGRAVPPAALAQLVEREPAELFDPIGRLERHGVLRSDDDGNVDFVHDLVRRAAYRRLSTSRRTMLHARISAVLASLPDPDDSLAADTARHADLGAASATCAAACIRSARRCLRVLAYTDAERLVALGRNHARRLPATERVAAELDLIRVLLHPGVRLREPGELARDLAELCAEAQQLGLAAELPGALSLLARAYHWGWGDIPRARALMQRAAELIESAREPSLEPLLEGARCLAYLEMDMGRTARLFDGLSALHTLAAQSVQYQWGLGLVQAWRGEIAAARTSLGQAIELAAACGDHWATFECTARLALLELEAGEVPAAGSLADQLTPLAVKLGEGSEQAYAMAISALAGVARHDQGAIAGLDHAISELERIDARFLVPDLHGIASELHGRAGDLDAARDRANLAVRVADEVARPFESARAHALLACIAAQQGDLDRSVTHLRAVDEATDGLPGHVEELRREAERLLVARHHEQGDDDTWP